MKKILVCDLLYANEFSVCNNDEGTHWQPAGSITFRTKNIMNNLYISYIRKMIGMLLNKLITGCTPTCLCIFNHERTADPHAISSTHTNNSWNELNVSMQEF